MIMKSARRLRIERIAPLLTITIRRKWTNTVSCYNSPLMPRLLHLLSIVLCFCSCWNFFNKVILRYYYVINVLQTTNRSYQKDHQQKQQQRYLYQQKQQRRTDLNASDLRILYCITSIQEYDNGRRETIEGYNRFTKLIVPVIKESVESIVLQHNFSVDVYLITHYNITDERYEEISNALPTNVGLRIWDDATPLGYATEHSTTEIQEITRSLSRQHRFVIKDNFLNYDIFINFEDDMLIRGQHIQHYLSITNELYKLRQNAPDILYYSDNEQQIRPITLAESFDIFYGKMTNRQISRMIPGFIRVEAALPGFVPHKNNLFHQIPIDYIWKTNSSDDHRDKILVEAHIDPSVCCHVSLQTANEHIPEKPNKDQLYFWETSIEALGVRKMPRGSDILDWVVLQGGSNNEIYDDPRYVIGDYWSGDHRNPPDKSYFGTRPRPDRTKGKYNNNQGGWIGTQKQILEWNIRWCRGGFLPPYDLPYYQSDGLDTRTVEYWSGGIQIVGPNACNLQRIITLDPDGFSKHLLYHASNNKQRVLPVRPRFSSRSINQFWGQLNTIKKNAEERMNSEMQIRNLS